jgi:hypothetical protein
MFFSVLLCAVMCQESELTQEVRRDSNPQYAGKAGALHAADLALRPQVFLFLGPVHTGKWSAEHLDAGSPVPCTVKIGLNLGDAKMVHVHRRSANQPDH